MWLLRVEKETVLSQRGQQSAVLAQVVEVQGVVDSLLQAGAKADAARKKIEELDDDDDRTAAAMAGSHPTQFVQSLPVNPDDVLQQAAFDVLRNSAIDVNFTAAETVFAADCYGFGSG